MARKMLLVDRERCTGCRMCEVACSLEHEGICAPGYARLRVIKDDENGIDYPLVCRHCTDPPCLKACPAGSLYFDGEGGVVGFNPELCIGCGLCFEACPAGAIFFDPQGDKIRKCDLCGGDPQCVKFCDTEAIRLVPRSLAYLASARRGVGTGSGKTRGKKEAGQAAPSGLKV